MAIEDQTAAIASALGLAPDSVALMLARLREVGLDIAPLDTTPITVHLTLDQLAELDAFGAKNLPFASRPEVVVAMMRVIIKLSAPSQGWPHWPDRSPK